MPISLEESELQTLCLMFFPSTTMGAGGGGGGHTEEETERERS